MGDGDCNNKEKRKKSFWVRWLSFFRRQFIFKKPKSFGLNKYDEKSLNKNENFNDSKIVSCTSMDIIEIPIQPGQKVSKILIKSTKNEIEAMIAQYDGRSLQPLKAKKFPLIYDLSKVNKKRKQFTNQNAEKLKMTWDHNFKSINGEGNEAPKNENSVISELYIRQDTDNVESTFFVEPKSSNECMEESVAINSRHISYRVFDEVTDEATKTFKTVSEPTWDEKEKIFHQQRLQENLNELLEQFLLLQSDDLINFAAVQNRVNEEKKSVQCDGDESSFNWAEGNNKRVLKRLSREVSPEILVNIKPFKQYLSAKYINLQEPTIQFVKKRRRNVTRDQERTKMMLKQKCRMQKKSEIHKTEKKTEDENLTYHCPVIRSKLQFSRTNNNLKVENSQMKRMVSDQLIEREENKNENMSIYILDCDLLSGSGNKESLGVTSGDSKARFANNTDFCSVWGVYKSYADLEMVDEKESHVKNKAIDEVLDSFDDKDHDLIFKKNMAQFKRKISAKAFFFEKNVNLSAEVLGEAKIKEKNISTKENGCELQDRFILNLKGKKSLANQSFVKISATAIIQNINYFNGYKLQKTLATYSWILLKQMEFCKTMASRIEVSTVKCPQASKEINNLLERNIKTVIEKKLSKLSGEETIILHKRNTEGTGFNSDLQFFLNFKYNAKDCVEIAFRKNEFQAESMYGVLGRANSNQWQVTDNASAFMCPKSLLNSTCCLNKLENYSFTNLEKPGVFKSSQQFLLKKSLEETSPVKAKTLSNQNGVNSFKNKGLTFYELPLRHIHKVVKIINGVTVQYHRKEYMSLRPFKSPAKNFSDTLIVKKNDQTSVSCFTSEILTANASSSDDKVPILNKISNYGSYGNKSPIQMREKIDEKCSVPVSIQFENIIHKFLLSESIKQRIIGKNHSSKEVNNELKTKSLVDFKFDGFRILYDTLRKGSLNNCEDSIIKTVSPNSFTMDVSPTFLPSEEKQVICAYDDFLTNQEISVVNVTELGKDKSSLNQPQEEPSRSLIEELSKIRISKTIHNKNRPILLKYKSSLFPKENILKDDQNMQEHRMRRPLNFVKDVENSDYSNYKKKRASTENGADIRKTGSALLETPFSGKLGEKKSFIPSLRKNETTGLDIKSKSQLIPNELKALRGTQYKNGANKPDLKLSVTQLFSKEQKMSPCVISDKKFFNKKNEKTKMFILEKNGVNIRKEIVAAFNSIKNFTHCRKEAEEGNKRMSLVIMLSRNK